MNPATTARVPHPYGGPVAVRVGPSPTSALFASRSRTHSPVRMHCIAAIGLFLITIALYAAVSPSSLRTGYPIMAFLLALFLFERSRTFYIGFVFWLWYLSPLLRRLVEYRSGFITNNPILLASFLATAVSGYVLVTRIRLLSQPGALPFACALGATLFGTVVGLTRYPVMAVCQAVLNWVVPVLFAFFLYAERHRYREYQAVIERSILYGTLVAGAYGVYQYFLLPDWDRQWMIDLNAHPFGVPEPLQLRVFSTLNAPATCGAYMMAGMLLIFALRGRIRILAAAVAFLSFLFTSSRSAWVGMVFGVGYLVFLLPNKARLRVAWGLLACVALLAASTAIPVVNNIVADRLQSFTNPKKDVSYNERLDGHILAFETLLTEPLGEGMGSVDTDHTTSGGDSSIGPHDSTLLEALYALGFPGSLLYAFGIAAAVFRIFSTASNSDAFQISLRAILAAFLIQITLNSIFVGVFGFLVWTTLAMALARAEPEFPVKPQNHLNHSFQ